MSGDMGTVVVADEGLRPYRHPSELQRRAREDTHAHSRAP